MTDETFDVVIIGSGFGGSVSALRLTEKGHRVLVLERGRRFEDTDFPRSNWNVRRYLWAPLLRCFGILQITPFRDVVALHGSGVGGGSLGYGMVLMEPDERLYEAPAWRRLADWRAILRPHYATAKRMLGVAENPCAWPADEALERVALQLQRGESAKATPVGAFFVPGREGEAFPDPYFGGAGPERNACRHCGACMVGCRYNAKNTLPKNYLWLAERGGAEIRAEREVRDIRPLDDAQPDGARFEVMHRRSTGVLRRDVQTVRARRVVVAAGTLGTLALLFRCRDVTRSLARLSRRLGDVVRTNSESLLGVVARDRKVDYSEGVAITSIIRADEVTAVEPVRYPAGSSVMRFLGGPLLSKGGFVRRLGATLLWWLRRPGDFLRGYVLPGWAERTTILLVMQTEEEQLRVRLGRSALTLWRRGLVTERPDGAQKSGYNPLAHEVARRFAEHTGGAAFGSINEGLFNVPMTAHMLGGCPFGTSAEDGVVDLDCQAHGYPGLHIVDGSIVPANPGVNPSLTITALAEYAMSRVPVASRSAGIPAPVGYSAPVAGVAPVPTAER